jgi:hypothetical protein
MTSRINARHTTCPGCQEEVFLDELVGGRCPLCGCALEEEDTTCEEFEEGLDRSDLAWIIFHYFIFKKFDDMGVSPLQIMQLISNLVESSAYDFRGGQKSCFELEVPMGRWDRIKPKRCSRCGGRFFRGGKKIISGDLSRPSHGILFTCPNC